MRLLLFVFAISMMIGFNADARLTPDDANYGAFSADSHASSAADEAYAVYLACKKDGGNCQPPAHMRQALGQGIGVEERVDAVLAGRADPGFQGEDSTR